MATTGAQNPDTDMQHESLHGPWWLLEFFPKLVWNAKRQRRFPQLGFGRHRIIPAKALIHRATLQRIRNNSSYSPPNMSPEFIDKVVRLAVVPDVMAYTKSDDE
jgi:hypothetical protein